jgi:hypothetical protein
MCHSCTATVTLRLAVYHRRVRIYKFPEPLRSKTLCNIFSAERIDLAIANKFGFCQVYVLHI